MAERGPDLSRVGHSRGHPLKLGKGLVIRGAGGSCLLEGSRGLAAGRQIHGAPGSAGLNTSELRAYGRERGLYPQQVDRWRQAAQDANAQPLLTMAEQKDLEKRHQADQREINGCSMSCAVRTRPWRRRQHC